MQLPRGQRAPALPGGRAKQSSWQRALPYAVVLEFAIDGRIDRFGGTNIRIAAGGVAFFDLGFAASVQGGSHLRVEPQRRIKVGDRLVQLPEFQIGQPATVEGVRISRSQLYCFVAVGKRCIEFAGQRADETTIVKRFGIVRVELDRLAEILGREHVFAALGENLTALIVKVSVPRVAPNRFVEL